MFEGGGEEEKMPIEWESGKGPNVPTKTIISGHPKKCIALPAHSTNKEGRCKTYYKCNFASTPGCVARGGV